MVFSYPWRPKWDPSLCPSLSLKLDGLPLPPNFITSSNPAFLGVLSRILSPFFGNFGGSVFGLFLIFTSSSDSGGNPYSSLSWASFCNFSFRSLSFFSYSFIKFSYSPSAIISKVFINLLTYTNPGNLSPSIDKNWFRFGFSFNFFLIEASLSLK